MHLYRILELASGARWHAATRVGADLTGTARSLTKQLRQMYYPTDNYIHKQKHASLVAACARPLGRWCTAEIGQQGRFLEVLPDTLHTYPNERSMTSATHVQGSRHKLDARGAPMRMPAKQLAVPVVPGGGAPFSLALEHVAASRASASLLDLCVCNMAYPDTAAACWTGGLVLSGGQGCCWEKPCQS